MMQKSSPIPHKGTSLCAICQQASSALVAYSEYEGTPKLVCHDCSADKRVELCHNCEQFIVAYDGQPCKDTIDAQQKGVLQWFCADCNNLIRPVTCLCGETTIRTTDGEIYVEKPERLNGQIYLCNTCKNYPPLELCALCKQRVVAVEGSSEAIIVHMSREYQFSDIVACRSCWSGSKTCGICDTPAADAQGKCFDGAVGHATAGHTLDYRCAFCNRLEPIKTDKDGRALYFELCEWFDVSGLGFKLDKYPPITIWDSYRLNAITGNKGEAGGHVYGAYSPKERQIYVEHFLPRVVYIASVAHELAHAWQDQQLVFSKQDDRLAEGFAMWVAYVYLEKKLSSFTDPQEVRVAKYCMDAWMANIPDPIYGEGLRDFLKIGKFPEREAIKKRALQTNKS